MNKAYGVEFMRNLATDIAKERIGILFELCRQNKEDEELCRYYVSLIWKIKLRYKVKLTKEQKLLFCKQCKRYFVHGKNVKVRLDKGRKLMLYQCICGKKTFAKYQHNIDTKQ